MPARGSTGLRTQGDSRREAVLPSLNSERRSPGELDVAQRVLNQPCAHHKGTWPGGHVVAVLWDRQSSWARASLRLASLISCAWR